MGEARRSFADVGTVDRIAETALADLFANWSIRRARDTAWAQAQALVALDGQPVMRRRCLLVLARVVGFVSRTLLVRTS